MGDERLATLATLVDARRLPAAEIDDLLGGLAASEAEAVEVAHRRWLLAHLVNLTRLGLDPDARLDALEAIYAEFGFPDELRDASRYTTSGPETISRLGIGDRATDPLDALPRAIASLRHELTEGR